jgi:hypothetical protein
MRRSKYAAIRTTVDGITFASKKEAKRYGELKVLLKTGAITRLVLQPMLPLHVPGISGGRITVGKYIADFQYDEGAETVVEDVKGMKTPVYRLKKKLVEALYGIQIREV